MKTECLCGNASDNGVCDECENFGKAFDEKWAPVNEIVEMMKGDKND